MIVTIDVVATRRLSEAFRIWREANRAWSRRERAEPGRLVMGAQYTFRGERLHAPWGRKPRILPNVLRKDGWGWLPDMRRVFMLTAWTDEPALEAYERAREWPPGAERWHARLRPVKVKGAIEREKVLGEFVKTAGTNDKPGIVVTWNHMGLWRLPAFRGWVRRIADDGQRSPGALASFNTGWVLGFPWFRAFTVTCWRELADSVTFAYKRETHAAVIPWYGNPERFGEPWWGRFVVEESSGTLAGRDPFAGLRLDAQPADEPALDPAASGLPTPASG